MFHRGALHNCANILRTTASTFLLLLSFDNDSGPGNAKNVPHFLWSRVAKHGALGNEDQEEHQEGHEDHEHLRTQARVLTPANHAVDINDIIPCKRAVDTLTMSLHTLNKAPHLHPGMPSTLLQAEKGRY